MENETPKQQMIESVPGGNKEAYRSPDEAVKEINKQLAERAMDGTVPVVQAGSQSGITRSHL